MVPQLTAPGGAAFSTGTSTAPPSVISDDLPCDNFELVTNDLLFSTSPVNSSVNVMHFSELKTIKGLKLLHINIRSLLPKFDEFSSIVTCNSLDIVSVNETWLSNSHEITIADYDVFRCDRDGRGGGVALYVKQIFKPMVVSELSYANLECVWVKITVSNRNILIGSCYRPPSASVSYFENILNNIQTAMSFNIFTVLVGD